MFTPCDNPSSNLEGEEEEESHHKTEETHSLWQGESQDGVREELLLEGGVAGIADDEGAEDGSDSGSGTGHADGGGAGADELGGRVDVLARHGGGDGAALRAGGGGGRLDKHGRWDGSPRQGVPGAVGHDDSGDGGHFCLLCCGWTWKDFSGDVSEQGSTEHFDDKAFLLFLFIAKSQDAYF